MSRRTHRLNRPAGRTLARGTAVAFVTTSVGLLVAAVIGTTAQPAYAADARVGLGTADSFAVLAGSTVTNTGPSIVTGDLGLSPGSAVTGFPPGVVVAGTQHISDAVAVKAKNDLTTAYNDAAGRPTASDVTGVDLGGLTLTPGVYEASTSMGLTGTLVLNAQNNPASVFIFKAGTTLTTSSNSKVQFINGGSPCNVFWQVGSSATLGTSTEFIGTIMASVSATLGTTATVQGRVLAMSGAVTLDDNLITAPDCAEVPTGTGTGTPTGTGTETSTGTPTGTGTETNPIETNAVQSPTPLSPESATPRPTDPRTPVIPNDHPDTGLGGTQPRHPNQTLLLLGGLSALGAVGSGFLGSHRTGKRRG